MSEVHELPQDIFEAARRSPDRKVRFQQGKYEVIVTLVPHASDVQTEVASFPTTAPPRMKLELLDENTLPPAKNTPPPPSNLSLSNPSQPARGTTSLAQVSARDALRTMGASSAITPVDFLSMLSEEERKKAEMLLSSLDGKPPTARKDPLEDTQPDPEEGAESFAFSNKFENAFLDDDDDGWLVLPTSSFRILRTTDTPQVLGYLFSRLKTPVTALDALLPLENSPLPASQLARAAGVQSILPRPIPFAHTTGAPPKYHLIGQSRDDAYVILYQEGQEDVLRFAPVPKDGGTLQIALVEGEELLTDAELTELFKQGARRATPEQAEATAKQLQKKLSQKADALGTKGERPLALSPVSIEQHRGLERAIPVDQRLLRRLEYNRTTDQEHLWDQSLQPGVAFFRYNLATLFQEGKPLLEGVLLCILDRRQYLVFDRRTKRSIPLDPRKNQSIWLRHDEKLI